MKRLILSFAMMFAFFSAANSQIVYSDLSDNPVMIGGSNSDYELNFMGGESEFMIQNYSSYGEAIYFASFLPGSAIVSTKADYNANVNALSYSTEIGPSSTFFGYDTEGSVYFNILYLPNVYIFGQDFNNGNTETDVPYVGFKFKNSGNTYYGWAQLKMSVAESNPEQVNVVLYGYAYQSTPNTPIKAGDKGLSSLDNKMANTENAITINVFPNPANEILSVNCDKQIIKTEITNTLGQRIIIDTSKPQNINISSLDKGVYCVSVETEDGIKTAKFIKE